MVGDQIRFNDGAAYERFMSPWSRSAGKVFIDWLKMSPDLSWVDVGCGNGAFTELIATRCTPTIVRAVDPSEAQIAFARERLTTKSVEFSVGNAMALPYADKSCDVAVMALVLFFVPDPKKGVAEMVRVAKPGATIASYTWDVMRGGFPGRALWEEMEALGKAVNLPPSAAASRIEVLKSLWIDSGVSDVETREIVVERTFTDFDDYWVSTVVNSPTAPSNQLSDSERTELQHRLQARLPSDAKGRITFNSCATAIKGRRGG